MAAVEVSIRIITSNPWDEIGCIGPMKMAIGNVGTRVDSWLLASESADARMGVGAGMNSRESISSRGSREA